MRSPIKLRAVLCAAAHRILAVLARTPVECESETEVVIDSGWEVTVQALSVKRIGELQKTRVQPTREIPELASFAGEPVQMPPNLNRRIHRKLMEAATASPMSAKRLATRAGYVRCNSYVRAALRELVEARKLRHVNQAYALE